MRFNFTGALGAAALAATLASQQLQASDVSLVSGVYQQASTEVQNDNKTGKTSLEVGGRFTNAMDASTSWLLEARFSSIHYDAAKGQSDQPSDNSIAIAGGVRWYFQNVGEKVRPYFQGRFGLKNDSYTDATDVTTPASGTTAATTASVSTKHDNTSLFYASDIGLMMDVSKSLFFSFELSLFESSIYGVDKTTTGEDASKSETKTTHLQLYAKSYGGLTSTIVGIGMKF